jgi:hypothetical protein
VQQRWTRLAARGGNDHGHVSSATERDERGGDDLGEVPFGNGALRDRDEAPCAVEMLPPRGLKYEALAESQLGIALFTRADEHGERAPVEGVSEDKIGGEIVGRHLEAGGPGGDVAGKEVDEIDAGHLHTGRLLYPLRIGLEVIERWESLRGSGGGSFDGNTLFLA